MHHLKLILGTAIAVCVVLLLVHWFLGPDGLWKQLDYGDCRVAVWWGRLTLRCPGGVISTERDWYVNSLTVGDANGDGEDEVVAALWKKGSFGTSRPFWVGDEDDREITSHLFLYGVEDGVPELIWGSSAVPDPIWRVGVLEPGVIHVEELFSRTPTDWRWNEWNFEKII